MTLPLLWKSQSRIFKIVIEDKKTEHFISAKEHNLKVNQHQQLNKSGQQTLSVTVVYTLECVHFPGMFYFMVAKRVCNPKVEKFSKKKLKDLVGGYLGQNVSPLFEYDKGEGVVAHGVDCIKPDQTRQDQRNNLLAASRIYH